MKKLMAILVSVIVLIILGTFLFKNQDQTTEPEKTNTETTNKENVDTSETETKNDKVNNSDETVDSFTFEPFTLTMEADNQVEVGKPFEVEASLKNTYNGPVTLKAGSKCTKEVTLILTPFEEYKEGQSPPECTDSTEDVEILVGDSIDAKTQFTAEKDGKYIVTAYFANMPLIKKVVTAGTSAEFDVKESSSNFGSLQLNVDAEGKFETGEPIYVYGALSNTGDNYISLNENSCQLDIEFKVTVDNEDIDLPETYGPCEDANRKFNLQSGDTIHAYTMFTPVKSGKYTVKANHVNNVTTVLEFDVK